MFSALIIDADPEAAQSIAGALGPFGFEFTVTQDASEAMTLSRSATPDIIFLRVELPNVSGFSVCNKLRRNDETKYIPLVMYASGVSDDVFNQHRNLKTHADEYIKLPFFDDRLVEAVRNLISTIPDEPVAGAELSHEAMDVDLDDLVEVEEPGESGAANARVDRAQDDGEAPPSSHLSMAEFDREFAEISSDPTGQEPVVSLDGLGEETEAAFDSLVDEPDDDAAESDIEPAVGLDESRGNDTYEVADDDSEDDEIEPGLEFADADTDADTDADEAPLLAAAEPVEHDVPQALVDNENLYAAEAAGAARSSLRTSVGVSTSNGSSRFSSVSRPEPVAEVELRPAAPPEPVSAPEPSEEAVTEGSSPDISTGGFRVQREVIQLKSQVNAKNREILSLKDELENRERAILDSRHKNRELMAQIGDLEEKLISAEEQTLTARELAEAATRDKATILKREEGLKSRLEHAQKKTKEVEAEVEQGKARFREVEAAAAARAQELQAETERVRAEVLEANARADALTTELEAANDRTAQAEARIAEAEGRIATLQAELQDQRRQASGLTDAVTKLESELSAAKQESERRLAAAAEQAQTDKEVAVRAAQQELQAELEFEESQHREALERMKVETSQVEMELRAQSDKLGQELQRAEQSAAEERRRLQGELDDTRRSAQEQSTTSRQVLAERDSELATLRSQLEQAQAELQRLTGDLSQTRTELDQRRDVERRAQQALAVALRVLDGQLQPQ